MQIEVHKKPTQRGLTGGLIFLAVFLGLNAYFLYRNLTVSGIVIWDFHPIFVAAGAVLDGIDPYSREVIEAIQILDYGRLAAPGEDVQAYAYPLFVAYLAVPFGLLPLPWAQAAWLTVLEFSALLSAVLSFRMLRWPKSRLAIAGLIVWSLSWYPVVWAFILGQISLLAGALLMLSLWAILSRRDVLAGLMLGLTAIKPQMSFLILPAVLFWSLLARRHRLVFAALAALGILVGLPLIFQPTWLGDFFLRLGEYTTYSPFTPPALVAATRCCPNWPASGPLFILFFLSGPLLGWWQAIRRPAGRDWLWAAGATLIASAALAPQTSIINQVILLLPLLAILQACFNNGNWLKLAGVGILLLSGPFLWWLSLIPPVSTAELRYPVEHMVLSPVLPVTAGIAWWALKNRLFR